MIVSYQYRSAYSGTKTPHQVSASVSIVPQGAYRRWVKRALDVAIVVMASLPVAMIIGIMAVLVARDLDVARPC